LGRRPWQSFPQGTKGSLTTLPGCPGHGEAKLRPRRVKPACFAAAITCRGQRPACGASRTRRPEATRAWCQPALRPAPRGSRVARLRSCPQNSSSRRIRRSAGGSGS